MRLLGLPTFPVPSPLRDREWFRVLLRERIKPVVINIPIISRGQNIQVVYETMGGGDPFREFRMCIGDAGNTGRAREVWGGAKSAFGQIETCSLSHRLLRSG